MDKVLLCINLGSPRSFKIRDVRAYLREFLMDGHVIDVPWLIRFLIVYLFVLPFRPKTSADAYRSIWMKEGSPLVVYTQRFVDKLRLSLNMPVFLGFTYGDQSIRKSLQDIHRQYGDKLKTVQVFPMFPHYAMSTYEAVLDMVRTEMTQMGFSWEIEALPAFYDHPQYIASLVRSFESYDVQSYDHIVLSYHGLPVRHIKKTDASRSHCLQVKDCCNQDSSAISTCYRAQVKRTTGKLVQALKINEDQYTLAFQSRFGKDTWLLPDTEGVLQDLGSRGVKKILVICPAFLCDCLETLEEIGLRGRDIFYEAGGDQLDLLPCLNDEDHWVQNCTDLLSEWQEECVS